MKFFSKAIISLSLMIMCFSGIAHAKTGDIIGTALNTDIVAYINHYALPSYAVNGQSAIIAEDLRNFGFDVVWNDANRTLVIARNNDTVAKKIEVDKSEIPSTVFSNIYETDIKVFSENVQITSYALNGVTAIPMEELKAFGDIIWVPEERALKMWVDGLHVLQAKQEVTAKPVILYDMTGNRIAVLPAEVFSYQNSGWMLFNTYIDIYTDKLIQEKDHEAAIDFLTKITNECTTEQLPYVEQKLTQTYQSLYDKLGVPIVIVDSKITYSASNVPQANIYIWNISGKVITNFGISFVCQDSSGKPTTDNKSKYNSKLNCIIKDREFTPGAKVWCQIPIENRSKTKSLGSIYVYDVKYQ